MTDPTGEMTKLGRFHPALMQWAEVRTPPWLRAKLDPGDLVQQTLLEAIRDDRRIAGRPEHEVLAFLRRALTNNLIDAARKFGRTRDDVPHDAAEDSARGLAAWLAAADTSPSERLARKERFDRLASGLARMPEAQRIAVEMRYLRGARVAEIAALLGRTEGAVTALLHRAVVGLKGELKGLDP